MTGIALWGGSEDMKEGELEGGGGVGMSMQIYEVINPEDPCRCVP